MAQTAHAHAHVARRARGARPSLLRAAVGDRAVAALILLLVLWAAIGAVIGASA